MATTSSAQLTPLSAAGERRLRLLGWVGLIGFVASQAMALLFTPPEVGMGHLQKIMSVHLPVVWSAFVAYFVVFVSGLVYLWRRTERADLLAASAAEVGTLLMGMTLMIGSIWARPTWGEWWTWDPRLTTSAILFILFVGYLSLRSFTEDADRRARWSAAIGILGFINVGVVYMSVRWWRSIHQIQSTPEVVDTVYVWNSIRSNGVAVLLLAAYLVGRRYRAALLERATEADEEERALAVGGSHV